MAVLEIIFAGLIAHFGFGPESTAVLVKATGHSPILAVTDPQGDTSFLGPGTTSNSVTRFSLRGQHIQIVLPPGQTTHDSTFDLHVPHLSQITGGNKPLPNVPAESTSPHIAAYVDYSGGTLYAPSCYFKDEEKLKLKSQTTDPFCPAQYTRFFITTNDNRITIINKNDRLQYFTVPAAGTIYVYNTSKDMAGGYSEYRWLIDDDKGLATFVPTENFCDPYTCKPPEIPGLPYSITSVTVECVNTQWP